MLIAIKDKKTRLIEDTLDNGNRFYSLNIITAGSGALHYGSIFLFDWYARRYKVIEEREKVPKNLQMWFNESPRVHRRPVCLSQATLPDSFKLS